MQAKDVIKISIDTGDLLVKTYLADLTDADLMVRPVAGMNHIAWQLGHLIGAERFFMELLRPGVSPTLPDGFDAAHSKEAASSNDPAKFLKKDKYIDLWEKQREATLKIIGELSDAELDAPGPEQFRSFCPTNGQLCNLVGTHVIMHAGQWVAVRRQKGLAAAF